MTVGAYRPLDDALRIAFTELVHWIHQILQLQDSDLHRVVKHFGLNPSNLVRDMTEALERLPRGSTTISDLSGDVEEAVERAAGNAAVGALVGPNSDTVRLPITPS